ncbi:IMPACT family protein [Zeaxanthinibacter enoshimensis]|uniref:Putative YigZ family protein n=1 Tax=Zeaxanthinibacter enoshimensis TaxID=392009 RepID=A0A4R6TPS7_9FLAO|nr:YigZ family protein [Zeaxanthinibacter enoshimensis]TDQ31645.1 putative YigZ family protein [Zeaxanthinibacter enoshimensis]
MENSPTDTYKTLGAASPEVLFKDRKSKFYGYAFPVRTEEEIKDIIENIRQKHKDAGHVCYAWRLGIRKKRHRANDDGEPNNSAGMPIYGQIRSYELTQVLVAVARVYGGTKLGVGGLIQAYKTAAQQALEASAIIEKTIMKEFRLRFAYPEMDKVMRTISQVDAEILSQRMEMDCTIEVAIRESEADKFIALMKPYIGVELMEIESV